MAWSGFMTATRALCTTVKTVVTEGMANHTTAQAVAWGLASPLNQALTDAVANRKVEELDADWLVDERTSSSISKKNPEYS